MYELYSGSLLQYLADGHYLFYAIVLNRRNSLSSNKRIQLPFKISEQFSTVCNTVNKQNYPVIYPTPPLLSTHNSGIPVISFRSYE